jgi:predicted P-loop ATPase
MKLGDVRALYEQGLALHYLKPKSKAPLENKWTSGKRKHWDELRDSFEKNYNLGVRLGEASKIGTNYLACIDVDIKDPACRKITLARLGELVGTLKFPEVRSGSGNGSRHLYCVTSAPFKMVTVAKEQGWEICIYSTGRQMVLPPSIHPDTGFRYQWVGGIDVAKAPLFDVSKLTTTKREAVAGLEHTLNRVEHTPFRVVDVDLEKTSVPSQTIDLIREGAPQGERSEAILSCAMSLCRAGLTDDEILSVLADENHGISEAAYARRGDKRGAIDWLRQYALDKARYNTDIMRRFDNPPGKKEPLHTKEVETLEGELNEIATKVLPDIGKGNQPKNTLRNVVHVLEHFMGGGLVGFNEFSMRAYFLKDTPYGGKKGQEISDHHDLNLMYYIACHYRFEPSQDLCFKAHAYVARKYASHPVRQYLQGLVWDEVPRLDSWLKQAFQASGNPNYLNAIGRKVLVAAVSRVMNPGCKFDHVLILEGNQGEGKSMSLGILASQPWFTDGLGDIHNKDVVDQMTGKWIVELGELAAVRGKENEFIKSFFSRQVDRVRMSYGRRSEDYPRQSIFIGSTNASEYLNDETGNRRYWPIKVGEANREWLTTNRDQLWAEAFLRYELGEDLYLTKDIESLAKNEQEKRFEVDEWEMMIKKYVLVNKTPFLTTEIFRSIHTSLGNSHPSMSDKFRIGKIMRRLGFVKADRVIDGVRGKCWVKK